MTLEATVSISWVQTVLAESRRQGVPDDSLLHAAGIAPDALTLERWPIDHITRLWRKATQMTQDPSFGLKAGTQVSPTSLNVVSFIIQSASTLRQAIGAAQKYQSLISDGGRFQLLATGESSWLIYHPRQGDLAFSPQQIEAVMATLVSMTQWITGHPLRPKQVRFSHDAQGTAKAYRQVFHCQVDFNDVFSGLLLDNTTLDRPLPHSSPQLAMLHETLANAQLSRLGQQQRLDQLVQAWITRHLGPELPTREQAAQALGLTPRTLARRLQALHTHYGALLDGVRKELALHQVAQTADSLKDIAHRLGFAEPSSFHRAFLRWSGATPGQWRLRANSQA